MVRTPEWGARARRIAAPASLLLVATVAILIIRGGPGDSPQRTTEKPRAAERVTIPVSRGPDRTPARPARYHVVETGDTFGAVATEYETTVSRLLQLNPGVEPTSLRVGQRIRVQ